MQTNNSKEKVRQLQNKLYLTAKKCDSRRFHALYDKVYRDDVLFEAWKRVKANKGSSGVDGIKIEDVEAMGIEKYLSEIKSELMNGKYKPSPVKRVMIPKPDGSERFYTYLTEYKECDDKFYLVYLKENIITAYMNWLKEYENQESSDINNYHFSSYDNEKIIDGKYFYSFQKSNGVEISSNIKFYEVDDINDIVYKFNGYQLVLCAQSKKAIIKENLSTNTTINKEIMLFNKYVLSFEDELSAPQHYLFDNNEKYNQKQLNKMFTYVGEMIESFPITYEEIEFSCFPILGLGKYWFFHNIRAEVLMIDGQKLILLPRYIISGDEYLDLLSYETNLFFEEDVFREYKELFSSAFVEETDINESFYLWGLYDYSIVASIIAN